MPIQPRKQVYYQDKDFILETEEIDSFIFLHCIVSKWTPSSLRRGYSIFAKLRNEAESKNKTLGTITPNPNFVKLFGGTVIFSFLHSDDLNYKVIIWD